MQSEKTKINAPTEEKAPHSDMGFMVLALLIIFLSCVLVVMSIFVV